MRKIVKLTGAALLLGALSGCPSGGGIIEEISACPAPLAPATCGPLLTFESDEQIAVATFVSGYNAFEALLPPDEQATAVQIFDEAMAIWNKAWQAFLQAIGTYSAANQGQIGVAIQDLINAVADLICVIETVAGETGCTSPVQAMPLPVGVNSDGGVAARMPPRLREAHEQLTQLASRALVLQQGLAARAP
jgi:hypothetical protein